MKKNILIIFAFFPLFIYSQIDTLTLNKYNKNGVKHGVWKEHLTDENHQTFTVFYSYENGKKEGQYVAYDSLNNLLVKGNYINDSASGMFENYFSNGQLKCKYYLLNGEFNGEYISYYENGNINEEKTLEMGSEVGDYKWYYKSGQLRWQIEQDTTNPNIKNYKSYYENGTLESEGLRLNGELEGTWNKYSEEGILIKKTIYKNGKIVKEEK